MEQPLAGRLVGLTRPRHPGEASLADAPHARGEDLPGWPAVLADWRRSRIRRRLRSLLAASAHPEPMTAD